jgi:hypothetical protein
VNGPVWLNTPNEFLEGVLVFDGEDDYVSIEHSTSMNPLSISIEAKFTTSGIPTPEQSLIDKRFGGYGYEMRTGGDSYPQDFGFRIASDHGSDGWLEEHEGPPAFINPDQTYFVTGTYDNSSRVISLYSDGSLISSHQINNPKFVRTTPSSTPATIGTRSWDSALPDWFEGYIDELAIYNRRLSSQEVERNYQFLK